MRTYRQAVLLVFPFLVWGQSPVPITPAPATVAASPKVIAPLSNAASSLQAARLQAAPQNLSSVRRVYVAQLTGGAAADALRELIITSLDNTRLFVITDDPERADAVLKGAADDRAYVDFFDSDKGVSERTNGGAYTSGSKTSKLGGYGGMSLDDRESHHIRERKHEAYASVRLCTRDGPCPATPTRWSTTQESLGSKFRGAGADVAAKIARQILADYAAARPAPRP